MNGTSANYLAPGALRRDVAAGTGPGTGPGTGQQDDHAEEGDEVGGHGAVLRVLPRLEQILGQPTAVRGEFQALAGLRCSLEPEIL